AALTISIRDRIEKGADPLLRDQTVALQVATRPWPCCRLRYRQDRNLSRPQNLAVPRRQDSPAATYLCQKRLGLNDPRMCYFGLTTTPTICSFIFSIR